MKKIIISVSALIFLSSSSVNNYKNEWVRIYCQADLNKCAHNLTQLKQWLKDDYEAGKIPGYVYDEYYVVLDNTKRSIEMLIKDEGQCETGNYKVEKLKYTTAKWKNIFIKNWHEILYTQHTTVEILGWISLPIWQNRSKHIYWYSYSNKEYIAKFRDNKNQCENTENITRF